MVKAFTFVLALICFLIVTTGGALFQVTLFSKPAKIDFTSVDVWALAIGLVVLVRFVYSKKIEPLALDLQALVQKTISKGSFKLAAQILAVTLGLLWIAHVLKHFDFATHAFDMSFVHPVLYHALSMPPLRCDVCINGTLLGEHMSFSFLLLAPIAKLFEWLPLRDLWVFLLQNLLLGGGVWLLIRACFPKDPGYAVLAVIVAISHRAFRAAGVWDLREDHLIFFFFCWGLSALLRAKLGQMMLAFGLALISKETVAFILPFVLIPVVYSRESNGPLGERRIFALMLLTASVLWAFLQLKVFFPMMSGDTVGATQMTARLGALGDTPAEVVGRFFSSPLQSLAILLPKIFRPAALKYMFLLVVPFLLSARKAWIWLIPVLPVIFMNVISNADTQVSQQFHYDLALLPFLFLAAFLGLRRLSPAALTIALFAMVGISGRWPLHEIRQHSDGVSGARDSIFLASIDSSQTLAADLIVLPQISQAHQLRTLKRSSPFELEQFKREQAGDNTRILGRSSLEADQFVLDMTSHWQVDLRSELQKRKAAEQVSPSGRFVLIQNALR